MIVVHTSDRWRSGEERTQVPRSPDVLHLAPGTLGVGPSFSDRLADLAADDRNLFVLVVENPMAAVVSMLQSLGDDEGYSAWAEGVDAVLSVFGTMASHRWSVRSPEDRNSRRGDADGVATTPPAPISNDTWARHWPATLSHLPAISRRDAALRELCSRSQPGLRWPSMPAMTPDGPVVQNPTPDQAPRSSVHTAALRHLLHQHGCSIAVTTYQSGYTLLISTDGVTVETQFPWMYVPMGMAFHARGGGPDRWAIGLHESILHLEEDAASSRADAQRSFFVADHVYTGNVLMHEMAYGADGLLYFCNTQYNSICRTDPIFSFLPIWQPEFISDFIAEDRCHLNGLAMVEGAPRFATALARSDTLDGWRHTGGRSGVVLDITTDDTVAEGLAMPHSPRWHGGSLWVIESGRSVLSRIDPTTGDICDVATIPGFGRGLAFVGEHAIVGFSKIRETVIDTLPIAAQRSPGNCGICLVDLTTGSVTGGMIFDAAAREIFDVQVLPHPRVAISDFTGRPTGAR